jgi:hypothetical protein
MVQGYPALKRGVAVALGSAPPLPGSLASSFTSSGLSPVTANMFNRDGSLSQSGYQSVLRQYATAPGSWDGANQPGSWAAQPSQGTQQPPTTASQSSVSSSNQQPYSQQQVQQQYPTQSGQYQVSDPYASQNTPMTYDGFYNVTDRAVADSASYATIECNDTSVSWSCSKSSRSRGISSPKDARFSTRGYLVGRSRVSARVKTLYTVQCLRNQQVVDQASCEYIPPEDVRTQKWVRGSAVLSLRIEPKEIQRGDTAFVEWNALRVESCELRARGLREKGIDGSIETPPLAVRGSHQFTLTCITESGERESVTETLTVE